MALQIRFKKYILQFKFEAGTSRGILKERYTYFVQVSDNQFPDIFGLGEAAPLKGLSVDDTPDFEEKLNQIIANLQGIELQKNQTWLLDLVEEFVSDNLPSLKFAFETALLDWYHGGNHIIFDNNFSRGSKHLTINGLIWMGEATWMQQQIEEKLKQGFTCLKMKIGAIDFEQEINLLRWIRERYDASQITLRVDANGAFSSKDVLQKLEQLSKLEIHSIEQPIKAGQEEVMAKICQQTPLPIALDEELIGRFSVYEQENLLQTIQPQYIILKPTLLGGLAATQNWIKLAEKMKIAWWITSALESNIGLNAIAQFTAEFENPLPQGLGTGALYHNNIASPLTLIGEKLNYEAQKKWEFLLF